MMWASLTDALSKTPMGVTAENLAEKYELTRQEVDEFALSSQKKWGEANQAGNFADEIAPMEIKSKKVCLRKLLFPLVLNISTLVTYIQITSLNVPTGTKGIRH